MPTIQPVNVDDIVYPAFSPQKVGKVVQQGIGTQVLVRWATKGNPETWETAWQLRHLGSLIAETQTKLTNHQRRYTTAQAL